MDIFFLCIFLERRINLIFPFCFQGEKGDCEANPEPIHDMNIFTLYHTG